MSLLNEILKQLQGGAAQINPFDGGQDYRSVTQPRQQIGYTPAQKKQMIPVGQPIPQDFMDSYSSETRELAQLYESNPRDPRVMNIDPARFGYAPDNAAQPPQVPRFEAPDSFPQFAPRPTGIQGAINPGEQIRRGGTIYGFGEGPRTRF